MKLSSKLLGKDEHVLLHVRTHVKAILPNLLLGLVVVAIAVAAWIYLPENWQPTSRIVVAAATALLLLIFVVWPWLNWLAGTYTVTNRRLITRKGVLTKTGHDIPLSRISNVEYEHSLLDRILGCGTLILQTSAADPLLIDDVPHVERVHVMLADLLFHSAYDERQAGNDPESDNY
ncbi:PH domain-containing protein [Arcanobacterium haemolyticum]|nr:PH domain-containing protein [Arcanobacterium haemolyticum]